MPITRIAERLIELGLRPQDVMFVPIRAQGAGGQNINKVSNAVQLRFDIAASPLPEPVQARLRAIADQRVGSAGVIVIKAQRFRSLEANRRDAIERLAEMIAAASTQPRLRRPTRPTRASQVRRVDEKSRRGQLKALRARVGE